MWGSFFCSRCEEELQHAPKLVTTASFADVRGTYADKSNTYQVMPEKSLNELADDVIGVSDRAKQKLAKLSGIRQVSTTEPYHLPPKQREKLYQSLVQNYNSGAYLLRKELNAWNNK